MYNKLSLLEEHGNVDIIRDIQYGQQRNAQEADELLT